MKIEAGDFVRTTDGGIYKVVDIDNTFIYVDKEVKYIEETNTHINYLKKSSVVKHSKNIIDLIEVGDIVNKVYMSSYMDVYVRFIRDKQDIETILTKEQYMQNCYKIPEKNSGND